MLFSGYVIRFGRITKTFLSVIYFKSYHMAILFIWKPCIDEKVVYVRFVWRKSRQKQRETVQDQN